MEGAMKFTVEKLNEAQLDLKNLGVEALSWLGKVFRPETRAEKINHWQIALKNFAGETLAWFDKLFPPETRAEKINHWQIALKNFAGETLAWFDKLFPPETRAEKINQWFKVAQPYLIAALVVTVVVWSLGRGRGGGTVKTMKAPGRNYRISRHSFESNPKGYFRNLRGRK